MYYVTSTTGSETIDRNGRSTGPELSGKIYSKHRTIEAAVRAMDKRSNGYDRLLVIDSNRNPISCDDLVRARAAIAKATGQP